MDYSFAKEIIERREEKVTSLYLNTTTKCNKQCSYCYMKDNNQDAIMLSYEQVEEHLGGITHITLLGGEPLLNLPILEKLLDNTSIEISISTGLGLSHKEFKKFLEVIEGKEKCISLQVSFDGTGSDRNANDFNKILCFLYKLSRLDLAILSIKQIVNSKHFSINKTREEVESVIGKEIPFTFEFATGELDQRASAITYIAGVMEAEVNSYLDHSRKFFFNDIDKFIESTARVDGFFMVANGCRAYFGGAKFIQADGSLDSCCMPNAGYTGIDKCLTCKLLPYCGVRCPVMVEDEAQCVDAAIKALTLSIYKQNIRNN